MLRLLGFPLPVLVAIESTGHYWKSLHAALAAAGRHVALLDPLKTRRFQDCALERTKMNTVITTGIARFAFEKRPEPTQPHDAAEALHELVRHRGCIRRNFDARVRQFHHVEPRGSPGLVDLDFPEFTHHTRSLDSMLATTLLGECAIARDLAQAIPRRLAKLRHVRRIPRFSDGRHPVGAELAQQLMDAGKRGTG